MLSGFSSCRTICLPCLLRFGLYEGTGFQVLPAAKAQGIAVAARLEKLGYLTASEDVESPFGASFGA